MNKFLLITAIFSFSVISAVISRAALKETPSKKTILAGIDLLEDTKVKMIAQDEATGVAIAEVNAFQESLIIRRSHELGRCGGYEVLKKNARGEFNFNEIVKGINQRKVADARFSARARTPLVEVPAVREAMARVNEVKIQEWVTWLSAFPTRYHAHENKNVHVEQLKEKLEQELANYPQLNAVVSLITHTSTQQKTVHLRIPGTTEANDIVALGAHLDSVKMLSPIFPVPVSGGRSPGADDDASGSANLLESLRVILPMAPFKKSIEFFWYAGEELGLLGSAEIAKNYMDAGKRVVGVLQLDMTMYPGSGEGSIASMTDFTSPELRELLADLNRLYLNVNVIESECGYGCSDHASWYRNGFPTLMPTEATMAHSNKKIHTSDDVINSSSSFAHSAVFSKIAVGFIAHLGNP